MRISPTAALILAPVRYRGCELCNHGGNAAGRCGNPEFKTEHSPLVLDLRAPGGACGPEAKALTFPGLED